jgi:hypothetical protein
MTAKNDQVSILLKENARKDQRNEILSKELQALRKIHADLQASILSSLFALLNLFFFLYVQ